MNNWMISAGNAFALAASHPSKRGARVLVGFDSKIIGAASDDNH
jgi:hypothetical protein